MEKSKRKQNDMKPKQQQYIADQRLVGRVRQYLTQMKNQKVINVNTMAQDLRLQYTEYNRRKENAFRKLVDKAYSIVCEDAKLPTVDETCKYEEQYLAKKRKTENDDNSNDSFSSDNEEYTIYENKNSMNNMMSNMYKKASSTPSNSRPSSRPPSGQNTPKRESDEQPLYFIDKTGSEKPSTPQSSNNAINKTIKDQPEKTTDERIPTSSKVKGKMVRKTKDDKTESTKKKVTEVQMSKVTFDDVGGSESTLKEIVKLLVHMKHPEVYEKLGVTPPRGFLLHGPPGCGKTLLAHAIAGELEIPFIKIAATEVVSGVSGDSEEKVRDLFKMAISTAPCILFFDEIDAITPKRETASKDMERRIVAQLLSCMDDLSTTAKAHVLVIGATNRPDSLDPALRRAGRFDREISLGIPDEPARMRIMQVLCRKLRLAQDFDYHYLARNTPGFVGADLMALAREAAMTAVNRVFHDIEAMRLQKLPAISNAECKEMTNAAEIMDVTNAECTDAVNGESMDVTNAETDVKQLLPVPTIKDDIKSVLVWLKEQPPLNDEQLAELCITIDDFQHALKVVQPSAKREGFATIPDVTWDDIGALQEVRAELQISVLAPVRHQEHFKSLGLTTPPGILLAGPPGCGKTLLAKAVANESGINFISVKGPELLNMYVGESERAVRQVFQRARSSAPCVIFFDELDALCPKRSHSGEGGASVRVVNQLLTEMDGLEERKQVFIMGATNRPDIIDPAILRPGRLDKILYVGLPGPVDRLDILKTLTKNGTKPKLNEDVDLEKIANHELCKGFTGADLAALVREASVSVLRECLSDTVFPSTIEVRHKHFETAFIKVKPSVSSKDKKLYESIQNRISVGADS
ncbi:nuclear valosin-containing protein-like [Tubulanus polymorphus]|uniref:nuclear valosin-containing protein-like n=1 Tax=Tubulanus polymorphus TaxID=672921 RepID=UPI003DA352F4